MQNTNVWSRRVFLARSAGLAVAGLAVPVLASCTKTSSGAAAGTNALDALKKQGFVNVGIAADGEPWGYLDKSGRVTGVDPEIARVVFKRLGVPEVRATQVSFEQLIPALNARQYDMVGAGMYIKPERCQNAQFSIPDYTVLEAFVVPKGNPKKIATLTDVAETGIKLAVGTGAAERQWAVAAGVKADRIVTYENRQGMLQAVLTGRADAAILPDYSWRFVLGQDPNAPVEMTTPFRPVVNGKQQISAGAFVFRKGEQELVDAFDRELKAIQDNGDWLKTAEPFGLSAANLPPKGLTTEQLCSPT